MRKLFAVVLVVVMFGSMGAALADDEVPETATHDDTQLSAVQEYKARMLADFFFDRLGTEEGTSEVTDGAEPADTLYEELVALRTGDEVVGWGALYHLLCIAEATDSTLATVADRGDGGWAFGKVFKQLRDADPEWRGDTPRNFGQFKKQQREANGTTHHEDGGSNQD